MSDHRKKHSLKKHLFNKNRIVLLNDESFEEIISVRLNLINVFILITVFSIAMTLMVGVFIAFTPLKEYIPGYSSTKLNKQASHLVNVTDSLENTLKYNSAYIEAVRKVLTGEVDLQKINKDSVIVSEIKALDEKLFKPSKADSVLRNEIALEDKYNLFDKAQPKVNLVLFPPVKGVVVSKYDANSKNYSVDIALPNGTPIKSVASGTVVFSEWTPTSGNVVMVIHAEGLMSVYKNCETLTKSQGDLVRTGEVVATSGKSGSSGKDIHLHFELWKNGFPIDPQNFIEFE